MAGLKLGRADLIEVEKLKVKLGFATREETIRHALVLLQILTDAADSNGVIGILIGEEILEVSLRQKPDS